MRSLDRLSGAALAALGLAVAAQAWSMGLGQAGEPGEGFMPFWIGAALAACGALLMAASVARSTAAWPRGERGRQMLLVVGALALYFALVPPLGFLLATALFLAVLLRAWGRYRWWLVALMSVVVSSGLWMVFSRWLRNPLPPGFWRDL